MKKISIIQIQTQALIQCLSKYRTSIVHSSSDGLILILLRMEEELSQNYPVLNIDQYEITLMNRREVLMYIADKTADLLDHSIVYKMYNEGSSVYN